MFGFPFELMKRSEDPGYGLGRIVTVINIDPHPAVFRTQDVFKPREEALK
jgi:hypothetical protein